MNHWGSIEEIARAACTAYGNDWNTIPQWSRAIWREAVRTAKPGTAGETRTEQCAIDAVVAWYKQNDAADTGPLEDEPEAVDTAASEDKPKKKNKK